MVRLSKSLQKTLRRCCEEEIRNLTEAMKNDEYWLGTAGKRNMIYVSALTKAIVPLSEGFQARTTFLDIVPVASAASPYCKLGCMLSMVKSESQYLA